MPELIKNAHGGTNDEKQPRRYPERDPVFHGGLRTAEIRQEAQLLKIQEDEAVQNTQ